MRSTTTSAVMILVRLAIGSTRIGSWRQSTSPLSRSNTRPAARGLVQQQVERVHSREVDVRHVGGAPGWSDSRGVGGVCTASGSPGAPPPASSEAKAR